MEELHCIAERITFQNEENGFSVVKCKAKHREDLVPVVGTMPNVHVGSMLTLQGQWVMDKKYGQQFSVSSWKEELPATAIGIEKYLGSGLIKGIGPIYAKRIVQKFGEDTLDIIETNPDDLFQVDGIGKKRVSQIKKSWQEQKEIKEIVFFLQNHDVKTSYAPKIFKTYGNGSVKILEENPYRLADDIWGIGFKTADAIAEKLGIEKNAYIRLKSGILYTLNQLSTEGHCYATHEQLINKANEILQVPADDIEAAVEKVKDTSNVVFDEDDVYLPAYYHSEIGCAKRLNKLMTTGRKINMDADSVLKKVVSTSKIQYEEVQLQAVKQAISSKVMVLTGGPGTGKTTTTLGIISAYKLAKCEIILAAPTGRAAKRMSEATGMEAKTIHRLLEFDSSGGYKHNAKDPLEGDVLIVDECSMIDIMLMYNLLKAVPDTMTLIFVGDINQLPSVGAGNVLKDIINSGRVPVVRLTKIFRQAQGSKIITNAHIINQGEMPKLANGKTSDFFFIEEENEKTADLIVQLCTKRLPAYYHADMFKDIQVLSPMKNGPCGTTSLNRLLQQKMNPHQLYIMHAGTQYRLHDKVMQIKNDYKAEVFNGDVGFIENINQEDQELTVNFGGNSVVYETSDLDELVLAYATTIHKSQGSEYPIVVMPLTMGHYVMLQRNLLYTAVTRAKKILVIVGEKKAIACAVKNNKTTKRNTKLAERIQDAELSSAR